MSDPLAALKAATGQSYSETKSDFPSIPSVPLSGDTSVSNFLTTVKYWLEKAAGSGLTSFVTKRELADLGVIQLTSSGGYGPGRAQNMAIPPAPTNVIASGAMTNILVEWDDPNAAYGNHAYAEIWAAETDNFSIAVLVGESSGFTFAHSVGAGSTRYYWVRFVSTSDVKGPYQGSSGELGETADDPAWLLSVLNNQITESQLYASLNARIDLIDSPSSVAGSVNARVQAVQDVVNDFLIAPDWLVGTTYATGDMVVYSGKLYRALRSTVGDQPNTSALDWQVIGDYTSLGATVAGHTTDISTLVTDLDAEVTARTTLAAGVATKRSIYRQGFAPTVGLNEGDIWIDTSSSYATDYFAGDYASIRHKMYQWSGTDWVDSTDTDLYDNIAALDIEQTVRADADNTLASQITTLTATVNTNNATLSAAVVAEQTARSNADSAISSTVTSLTSTVNTNNTTTNAAIVAEQTARASADSAIASSVTTLQSTVNGHTTSIQTNAETIDGIGATYTVKIDNNGVMGGYGLTSELAEGGTATSKFIASVDQFAVVAPNRTSGQLNSVPFAVLTTAQTINGVSFSPGVYIDGASINTGTIGNAQIGNAVIDNAKIIDATIHYAKIGSVNASTISVGTLSADRIAANSIGADKIDTQYLNVKYQVNVGAYNGFAWPAAGQGGAHLSADGFLIGNYNGGGKYFQITSGYGTGGDAQINTNIPAYIEDLQVDTIKIKGGAITSFADVWLGASYGYLDVKTFSVSYIPYGWSFLVTIVNTGGTGSATISFDGAVVATVDTDVNNLLTYSYSGARTMSNISVAAVGSYVVGGLSAKVTYWKK